MRVSNSGKLSVGAPLNLVRLSGMTPARFNALVTFRTATPEDAVLLYELHEVVCHDPEA